MHFWKPGNFHCLLIVGSYFLNDLFGFHLGDPVRSATGSSSDIIEDTPLGPVAPVTDTVIPGNSSRLLIVGDLDQVCRGDLVPVGLAGQGNVFGADVTVGHVD